MEDLQKKIALQPSVTTSTDQNISTGDVTRVSNQDHIGGNVAMEGDSADENSAGRPNRQDQTSEGGSRRRESHVKSEVSNRAHCDSSKQQR